MYVNELEKQEMLNKKDDMVKMYNSGHGCDAVARQFGFSSWKTREFLKKHTAVGRRRKITEKQILEIIKDYKSGMSSLELGRKNNVVSGIIIKYLRKNNVAIKSGGAKEYRKHHVDKYFFRKEFGEKLLWVLGWIYSDGNVAKDFSNFNITCHTMDSEVFKKIEKHLNGENLLCWPKNQNICWLRVHSIEMANDLNNLGCIPNKSLVVKYPDFLKNDEQNLWFLRGIFEGDGHVSLKHKGRSANAEIACGSLDFLLSIRVFLNKLGISNKILENKNNNGKRILITNGIYEIERFMDAIYSNASPDCRMDRKYGVYLELKKACAVLKAEKEAKLKNLELSPCNSPIPV